MYDIPVGCPPGINPPREDYSPRTTPSSDNPLSGNLFLSETQQGCHICIMQHGQWNNKHVCKAGRFALVTLTTTCLHNQ